MNAWGTEQPLTEWSEDEVRALGAYADAVIPGGAGMPSASAANTMGGINRVLGIRPDFTEPTRRLMARILSEPEWTIAGLLAEAPDDFRAASELVAGSYFLQDEVAAILKYKQRVTVPLGPVAPRVEAMEELVRPVVDRGNVWKTTR